MTAVTRKLLDVTLRRSAGVVEAEVDGEMVLFQPDHESLTLLDPVGTVIWTLLDGSATVRTLCDELAEAYRAPAHQVQYDVLQLVVRLQQDELLVEVER